MTTQNKLTITAHKENVRMKFEDTNSDEENKKVEQLFLNTVKNAPDVEFTLRGSMRTDLLLNSINFTLYNDSKSRYFCIPIED